MEQGTTAVIASSCSVEETKARLADVVARSEEINNLMQSISNSTVSQAKTSQAVSRLMEQVTQSSQDRSQTSGEVAEAIQETVQIAKALEASVKQFRVK
jgi:twitching motility protein PilJ